MVYAVVLAGGTGTRLGGNIPKQYILVNDKPIIMYTLEKIEKCLEVDKVVIVLDSSWKEFVNTWIEKEKYNKVVSFADAGTSRQHSILNGLIAVREAGGKDNDIVIIHDGARPNVTMKLFKECVDGLKTADGVMPVLPVKDTIYFSNNGNSIDSLLDRDKLFAGQAPESFRFGKYLKLHNGLSEEELGNIRGSSELAYRAGLNVLLVNGDENNYKITTAPDLEKFRQEIKK